MKRKKKGFIIRLSDANQMEKAEILATVTSFIYPAMNNKILELYKLQKKKKKIFQQIVRS